MLPKTLRIKVSSFNKIPQRATKKFFSDFNLFIKKSDKEGNRFVISVPKALDKRSTKRNRTKRVLEQAILSVSREFTGTSQILIRMKKIITKENKQEITRELLKELKNESGR